MEKFTFLFHVLQYFLLRKICVLYTICSIDVHRRDVHGGAAVAATAATPRPRHVFEKVIAAAARSG